VVTAINSATSSLNVFTELKPINASASVNGIVGVGVGAASTTSYFASARENDALLQRKDADRNYDLSFARVGGKNPYRSVYINNGQLNLCKKTHGTKMNKVISIIRFYLSCH
ncbi:hypothetical protein ALC60_01807, partial [Trachymyrmex zeteki]